MHRSDNVMQENPCIIQVVVVPTQLLISSFNNDFMKTCKDASVSFAVYGVLVGHW